MGRIVLIAIIIIAITCACMHLVKCLRYKNKPSTLCDKPCYEIKPDEGDTLTLRDSGYVIRRMGYFIGQGSKNGIHTANVRIDLRFTSTSSIYKAIGVLESDGVRVAEETVSPTSILLNIDWAKSKAFANHTTT